MHVRSGVALALMMTLAAAVPGAALELYECTIGDIGSNLGYLPETVFVAREPGGAMASVNDPIIQATTGGPMEVPVETDNAARFTMSWTLMAQSTSNDYVKMHYRLTIRKGNLAASMQGKPMAYHGVFVLQGQCKRAKG